MNTIFTHVFACKKIKRSYQLLCLLLSLLAFSTKSFAQNNLAAGDLAFVSYQSDFDASNPIVGDNDLAEIEDRFSVVITKSGGLSAGTVIFFTTRGWNAVSNNWHDVDFPPNTFGLGRRAVVQWTVPAGGIVQGTEVFFFNKYHDEAPVGQEYYDWGAYADYNGTITRGVVANVTPILPAANSTDGMSLSFSGDHLLVYQTGPVAGPNAGPNGTPIRFITALMANNNGTTTFANWDPTPAAVNAESSVPPGLTNGQTCFLMSPGPLPAASNGTSEPDNGKFSACALSGAGTCTAAQMAAIIYNTANWTYSNSVFPLGTSSSLCTYTILPNNTAGAPSSNPTVCVNTLMSPGITIATTGATGIGAPTGLPSGVTASFASNTITISGTPTTAVGSPFNYSIPLTGGCGSVNATGTITVRPNNTAGASSSNPTLCVNTALTNITHSTTGATGIANNGIAGANGLPAGVSASWATNTITINGTPTASGTFNYSIPLTGGCGNINATGTITVNASSLAPTGATGTTTICNGGNTSLTVTGGVKGAGGSTQWYTGSCGGSLIFTGDVLSVSPAITTNYFVRYTGTCNTTTCATVQVTVNNPSLAPTSISGQTTICTGSSTMLTAVGGTLGTGANYQWGTGSIVGTSPLVGQTAVTLTTSPGSATTYWVRIENTASPCTSTTAGTPKPVTVNTPPNNWTGAVSTAWENPNNWTCGVVADANTDVVINSGTVIVSSNAICRSLRVNPAASITTKTGFSLKVMH